MNNSSNNIPVYLSVIMPAYNEQEAIKDAVWDVQQHILAHIPGTEFIIVDDGSRDRTGAILDNLAAQDSSLCIIHQSNGGHGAALRTGLDAAHGQYLLLLDSDRQIPLEGFCTLWAEAQKHDGVFGIRRQRHDPPARLVLTRIVRATLHLLLGVILRDANIPFKIVRRASWEQAWPLIPTDTLAPSLFLAIVMRWYGANIIEREVVHKERESGTVTLRYIKLFRFCARGFRQLLTLRQALRHLEPPAVETIKTI